MCVCVCVYIAMSDCEREGGEASTVYPQCLQATQHTQSGTVDGEHL